MSTSGVYTAIQPQETGFDPDARIRLEEHFKKLIEQEQIQSAAYLISAKGTVFAKGAFGQLKHDAPDSVYKEETIRKIASVTKLFTATAIFQLVEQGKLFLRQSVSEWIEEFKNPTYDKIQIWHLLTHTSGLQADPGYFQEPYPRGWWDLLFAFEPETEGPYAVTDPEELEKQRRSQWLRALLSGQPLSAPGVEWSYSSAGFCILGEIVARASGIPFEQYVMEKIVQPLGMHRTFFVIPQELHAEVCWINEHDVNRDTKQHDRTYSPPRAGGGMSSTLDDLFRFGQMLLNNGTLDGIKILSRKSVEKMSSNVLNSGIEGFCWGGRIKNFTYGLGANLTGHDDWLPVGSYGHEGAGRCKLIVDPQHQSVVVFFVPSNSDWCPESINGTQNIIGSGWL
ncbi:CubicO group peptidase, beta-lactamase class C family [Paenibacillus catalpae]|uniref:CubicO group peptidase, beta-lactamase class C family n=1 Tax=Paenibacillus catalpae TaxID=1045775 RepID=A0A1I1VL29_9BACL|nr:serine hydrolase domain-containing protein [Paenibacillus catalpae]SFD83579.1 CubicO group peptidase, beta-lactamase class C family [Paenibacillus catalpae]